MKKRKQISSRFLFLAFLLALGVTILTVFITGLDIHRSLYSNTLITLSIITTCFILFLTAGLYLGLEMKDTLDEIDIKNAKFTNIDRSGANAIDGAELGLEVANAGAEGGIEGCLFGILVWILVTVGFSFLLFFFESILLASLLLFAGALYWIFFRAVGLVLKQSERCEDKFWKSLGLATFYSLLYSGWIYGMVIAVHYWK